MTDGLTVNNPDGVLHMSRGGLLEQHGAECILRQVDGDEPRSGVANC